MAQLELPFTGLERIANARAVYEAGFAASGAVAANCTLWRGPRGTRGVRYLPVQWAVLLVKPEILK